MGMIQDKVVVVTGAGAGIGRDFAKAFAAHGAKVVVNDLARDKQSGQLIRLSEADLTAATHGRPRRADLLKLAAVGQLNPRWRPSSAQFVSDRKHNPGPMAARR